MHHSHFASCRFVQKVHRLEPGCRETPWKPRAYSRKRARPHQGAAADEVETVPPSSSSPPEHSSSSSHSSSFKKHSSGSCLFFSPLMAKEETLTRSKAHASAPLALPSNNPPAHAPPTCSSRGSHSSSAGFVSWPEPTMGTNTTTTCSTARPSSMPEPTSTTAWLPSMPDPEPNVHVHVQCAHKSLSGGSCMRAQQQQPSTKSQEEQKQKQTWTRTQVGVGAGVLCAAEHEVEHELISTLPGSASAPITTEPLDVHPSHPVQFSWKPATTRVQALLHLDYSNSSDEET